MARVCGRKIAKKAVINTTCAQLHVHPFTASPGTLTKTVT